MPFKSKAQQRFMYANKKKMEAQGVDVEEWSDKTDYKHLPEKAKKEKKAMFPAVAPSLLPVKVAWDMNPRVRAAADIGALGWLAEPTVHKWISGEDAVSEKEKDWAEVGGLGTLAAIEVPHLFKQPAEHMPAMPAPKVAESCIGGANLGTPPSVPGTLPDGKDSPYHVPGDHAAHLESTPPTPMKDAEFWASELALLTAR